MENLAPHEWKWMWNGYSWQSVNNTGLGESKHRVAKQSRQQWTKHECGLQLHVGIISTMLLSTAAVRPSSASNFMSAAWQPTCSLHMPRLQTIFSICTDITAPIWTSKHITEIWSVRRSIRYHVGLRKSPEKHSTASNKTMVIPPHATQL